MSITATVIKKTKLNSTIVHFEIKPKTESGTYLEAGSHIDIYISNGKTRQYSIFTTSSNNYHIAVQREEDGRGGSKDICDNINEGDVISISEPRNNFKLDFGYDHYILIGGGIGITPIIAMAERLHKKGKSFDLHYCARNNESAAFKKYILEKNYLHSLIHLDDGSEAQRLNFREMFETVPDSTQVYMCGPQGFMSAIEQATEHWGSGLVKKEHFSAPSNEKVDEALAFSIRLKSSDEIIEVAADESIIEALKKHDILAKTSCSEGVCGSCIMDVISGSPLHYDSCLTDEEKACGELIVPCVSRAKPDQELVLDL